jgi:hypothetical protein
VFHRWINGLLCNVGNLKIVCNGAIIYFFMVRILKQPFVYYCVKSNSMKGQMLLCSFMLLCVISFAQLKLTGNDKSNSFSKPMTSVLMDYPYNFRNISGELELAQAEIENYVSRVSLPGAAHCVVTRYHSDLDTTASWQALMFSDEDFEKAAKQYQQIYKQLSNSTIRMIDGSPFYLKGKYEAAKEEMDFVTSTLKLQTADIRFKNVRVEVELLYRMSEWVVYVHVGSKEDDDKVRPSWMEGEER